MVRDPDRDAFIDVIVTPAAHLERLDEVLVITSTEPRFPPEQQQDLTASDKLEGAVPPAIRDQVKASEIMAEKLPGLIDPNLPADQQPLHDTSNPNPATQPPQPLHPDEFSPGAAGPAMGLPDRNRAQTPRPDSSQRAHPQRLRQQAAPQGAEVRPSPQ